MLNAVALNAILDVDEFLFMGMTPIKVYRAIQRLKPMPVSYSRQRSQCESLVHFLSLTALVLLAYFLLLVPLSETMLIVKNEFCGGNELFVVTYNSDTQRPFGLVTTASRRNRSFSASERAVHAHKATSPETTPGEMGATYIFFSANKRLFEVESSRSMAQEASDSSPVCIESTVLKPGGIFSEDAVLLRYTTRLLNNAAASLGLSAGTNCKEMSDRCDDSDARLLRWVCGETCGCNDPFASPWYKVEAQGCATACMQLGQHKLQNRSCEDVAASDNSWQTFWSLYTSAMTQFLGQDLSETQSLQRATNTIAAMLSEGCPALAQHPTDVFLEIPYCDGHSSLFRPLASLCPQSCGCGSSSPSGNACPSSCLQMNRSAS